MDDQSPFSALESENAKLRAAIRDYNTSLNGMAMKLAICAHLLGFSPDETEDQIRDKVRMKLRSKSS